MFHFPNSSADIDEKEDDLEPVEDVRDQEIHLPPQRKRASSARTVLNLSGSLLVRD